MCSEVYNDMVCYHYDEQRAKQTAGPYQYVIQNKGMSYVAFCNLSSMMMWMEERGLSLDKMIDVNSWVNVQGKHREVAHMETVANFNLRGGRRSMIMSNGDWTECVINDDDGIRTIHYLNVNVRDRKVFDWKSPACQARR